MSILTILLLAFGISQLYWAWRGYALAARRFPSRGRRLAVIVPVLAVYLVM